MYVCRIIFLYWFYILLLSCFGFILTCSAALASHLLFACGTVQFDVGILFLHKKRSYVKDSNLRYLYYQIPFALIKS